MLEVAIALMILGVLSTVLLESTLTMQKRLQMRTTQDHMEMILASLAAYALRHSCLPSPDKSFLKDGDTYIGAVPCKELGLAPHIAQDGWKQPIIYAVAEDLTKTKTLMKGEEMDRDLEETFCDVTRGTLHLNTMEMPSSPNPSTVIAIILYSTAGALPSVTDVFDGTVLKMDKEEKGIIRWVSRDVLMAAYAHFPCQQTGGNAERPVTSPGTPSNGTAFF